MTLEEELQDRLRLAWEGQSLLTQLVHDLSSDLSLVRARESARKLLSDRLVPLIGHPRFLMVAAVSDRRFALMVPVGTPTLEEFALSAQLLQKLTTGQDYVAVTTEEADHAARSDKVYSTFSDDRLIENFPLCVIDKRGSLSLKGFVAFAAKTPLEDALEMGLIRATVRGVLTLATRGIDISDEGC